MKDLGKHCDDLAAELANAKAGLDKNGKPFEKSNG